MKLIKYFIPLLVLFLSIGYAATNVTMTINGDAAIASDIEDFEIYISSIKLNEETDISLLKSELEFELTINNDESSDYIIEYEITNASEEFDAIIEMKCEYTAEGSQDQFENNFDSTTPLIAKTTRKGISSIKIIEPFGDNEETRTMQCKIEAIPIERNELGEGETPEALVPQKVQYIDSNENDKIDIGDEVDMFGEKFNIIEANEANIVMLAKYNISLEYKQSNNSNLVVFSQGYGWEYTPGPEEIDIETWSNYPKDYINNYVLYLQTKLDSILVSGDLITLKSLNKLGCIIQNDYSLNNNETCADSPYKSWLANEQPWWTKSSSSDNEDKIWAVSTSGRLTEELYNKKEYGIRPTITIPYETFIEWSQTKNKTIEESITQEVND